MTNDSLKTPSRGIWLVLLIGVMGIASASIGGTVVDTVAGLVVCACLFIAASEVARWLWQLMRRSALNAVETSSLRHREEPAASALGVVRRDSE